MKNSTNLGLRKALAFALCCFTFMSYSSAAFGQDKGTSGALDLDDTYSPEAELMAYFAVSRASGAIAQNICGLVNDGNSIAIYNSETKTQIINYQNTLQILDSFKKRFEAAYKKPDAIGLTPELIASAVALNMAADQASGQRAGVPFVEADQTKIALAAINGTLSEMQNFLNFFKTDIKEKGFKITIDKDKLVPEVANQIVTVCSSLAPPKRIKIYDPHQVPFSLTSPSSALMTELQTVYELRYNAEGLSNIITGARLVYRENLSNIAIAKTAKAKAEAALDAAKTGALKAANADEKKEFNDQAVKVKGELAELDETITQLTTQNKALVASFFSVEPVKNSIDATIKQFDAFVGSLFKKDDDTPSALLVSLFEAENVTHFLTDTNSYVLDLSPNTAGSTRRVKRNLFLDLFFPTGRTTFNGEAAIGYSLFKNDATLSQSCIVRTYIDFHHFKKGPTAAPVLNSCSVSN